MPALQEALRAGQVEPAGVAGSGWSAAPGACRIDRPACGYGDGAWRARHAAAREPRGYVASVSIESLPAIAAETVAPRLARGRREE